MKNLINIRNYILIFGIAITCIMLGLFLILGTATDKIKLSIVSLILSAILYFLLRYGLVFISKNASQKTMTFFSCSYIICFLFCFIVYAIPFFVMKFPNGYTPAAPLMFAGIVAVLDFYKKAYLI